MAGDHRGPPAPTRNRTSTSWTRFPAPTGSSSRSASTGHGPVTAYNVRLLVLGQASAGRGVAVAVIAGDLRQ